MLRLGQIYTMQKLDSRKIARGLVVVILAAIGGAILGAPILGIGPIKGFLFVPFTLFGAIVVLLPAHVWSYGICRYELSKVYLILFCSGVAGGFVMLLLFFLILGGVGSNPGWLPLAGSLFGATSAIAWIAAHQLCGKLERRLDQLAKGR